MRPLRERPLERVLLLAVQRPAFHAQPRPARDDVVRARLRRDVADRGDAAGETRRHRLAHAEHEGRGPEGRVAARVHRGRPGMPRLALEHDAERGRADDPRDDADVDAGAVEHRALLDVELEVAGERGRVAARGEQAFLA